MKLENSQPFDEMTRPVGAALNILANSNLSLRRGRIDHPSATQIDANMAFKADDIASLQIVHIRDNRIFRAALPCRRSHIALIDSRLIEAVIYEAGAVKYIRSLTA